MQFVSLDDSFDKDDLTILLNGAYELEKKGYNDSLSFDEKEHLLRVFEKSNFGQNFLSLLLNYTLESMFASPIYGSNQNGIVWKNYNYNAGFPQPKVHFGKIS